MNFQNASAASLSDAVAGTGARPVTTAISNPDRLAHESIDAVASGAHAARQQAVRVRVRDASSDFVREHPLQSMLPALGTGAALAMLAGLLTSPRGRVR